MNCLKKLKTNLIDNPNNPAISRTIIYKPNGDIEHWEGNFLLTSFNFREKVEDKPLVLNININIQ